MPKCYGAVNEEPMFALEENSWPEADKDFMPDEPGKDNEMGIVMPAMLENVPGEPQIGQDKIIDQGDDHIILEYEIEFPRVFIDDRPGLPGSE